MTTDQDLIALYVADGTKRRDARMAGSAFVDWLLELANIADPEDPAQFLAGSVILNEECWFDAFSGGMSPAECWAEECSYD